MTSLSFPDVNVWLAVATPEHVHHGVARRWWEAEAGRIAFSRVTQLGFLGLMTTAAAMDGKPLTVAEAWQVHDRLFEDDRVSLPVGTGGGRNPLPRIRGWSDVLAQTVGGRLTAGLCQGRRGNCNHARLGVGRPWRPLPGR